jgi:predicted GNAT family acetyltransferase
MIEQRPAAYSVTREGETAGALVLWHEGRRIGRLDFRVVGPLIHIDYVVVDPSLRGQGLGVRLLDAAAGWARETGRPLRPICGYAARVLRSDSRFHDVLESGSA